MSTIPADPVGKWLDGYFITDEEIEEYAKALRELQAGRRGYREMPLVPTTSGGGATSYYELPEGATELIDLIEYRGMNFSIGNIFKACYRQGQKSNTSMLYDINKIIYFAEREKARLEREIAADG